MKPCRITTAAAEGFTGLPLGEAIVDGLCPGAFQDCAQILLKEIPQGDIPLMIQAAGHNSAIPEYSNLIPQAIAEIRPRPLLRIQIRPIKFISGLQEYFVP